MKRSQFSQDSVLQNYQQSIGNDDGIVTKLGKNKQNQKIQQISLKQRYIDLLNEQFILGQDYDDQFGSPFEKYEEQVRANPVLKKSVDFPLKLEQIQNSHQKNIKKMVSRTDRIPQEGDYYNLRGNLKNIQLSTVKKHQNSSVFFNNSQDENIVITPIARQAVQNKPTLKKSDSEIEKQLKHQIFKKASKDLSFSTQKNWKVSLSNAREGSLSKRNVSFLQSSNSFNQQGNGFVNSSKSGWENNQNNRISPLINEGDIDNYAKVRKLIDGQTDIYTKMQQDNAIPYSMNLDEIISSLQTKGTGSQSINHSLSQSLFSGPSKMDFNRDTILMQMKNLFEQKGQKQSLQKHNTSRYEVQTLSKWLSVMLLKIHDDTSLSVQQLFEKVQIIYQACFQEILRQVAVECVERSDLLENVWNNYSIILEKTIQDANKLIRTSEKKALQEQNRIHQMYTKTITEHNQFLEEKLKELEIKDEKLRKMYYNESYLRKQYEQTSLMLRTVKLDYADLQGQYTEILNRYKQFRTNLLQSDILSGIFIVKQEEVSDYIHRIDMELKDSSLAMGNHLKGFIDEPQTLEFRKKKQIEEQEVEEQYTENKQQYPSDILQDKETDTLGLNVGMTDQEIQASPPPIETKSQRIQTLDIEFAKQVETQDKDCQTTELDPEEHQKIMGMDIQKVSKVFDLNEKSEERFEDAITQVQDLKLRQVIFAHVTLLQKNMEKVYQILKEETAIKSKYFKQNRVLGIENQELKNVNEEITEENSKLLQQLAEYEQLNSRLMHDKAQIDKQNKKLQLKLHKYKDTSEEILQSTKKTATMLGRSNFFKGIARQSAFFPTIFESDASQEQSPNQPPPPQQQQKNEFFQKAVSKLKAALEESESSSSSDVSQDDINENKQKRGSNKHLLRTYNYQFGARRTGKKLSILAQNFTQAFQIFTKTTKRLQSCQAKMTMPKKASIKFINALYQERNKLLQQHKTTNLPFTLTVYDYFLAKYGLKKVAEQKLVSLLEAIHFFSNEQKNYYSPRMKLFGKLLQLFSTGNFEPTDVDHYLTTLETMKYEEQINQEVQLISYDKCLLQLQQLGKKGMSPEIQQQTTDYFKKKSLLDKNNPKGCIQLLDIDIFLDKYLTFYTQINRDDNEHYKQVFATMDLNDDGSLEFYDFICLIYYVEQIQDQQNCSEIQKQFYSYCNDTLPNGQRIMNLQSFCQMCQKYKWLGPEKIDGFIQQKDPYYEGEIQDLETLQSRWKKNKQIIKNRLFSSESLVMHFQKALISIQDNVQKNFKNLNKNMVLLSYRIIDRESKRAWLNYQVEHDCLAEEFSIISNRYKFLNGEEEEYNSKDVQDMHLNLIISNR